MDLRTLGRTGLRVSGLALGTVELGMDYGIKMPGAYGQPAQAEAIRLVHAALTAGINFIDTARAYGNSEAVLGQALRGKRGEVVLATKVAIHGPDGKLLPRKTLKQHMLTTLETSLSALQTDSIDLWYIHNVDQAVLDQVDLITEIFAEAKTKGKISWCGASMYGVDVPLAALTTNIFDVIQVTYSVLDQRLADQVFALAAEKGVGVVVRSVLLQGALTERGDHLPDHLEPLRARSRQFRQLVADSGLGLSPAQMALAFGLAHPHIGSVLVGVRSEAELAEDLQATQVTLPDALLRQLYRLRLDDPDLLNPGIWQLTHRED